MVIKFLFDRVLALIGLLLFLPIFLIFSLLIIIKMPGPVFFVQERVGKDSKIFKCHKFVTEFLVMFSVIFRGCFCYTLCFVLSSRL